MIRNQQEIMDRFNSEESKDLFGTQMTDLLGFMDYENVKPHLIKEFIEKVEKGEEVWTPKTDAKKEILNYLDFAYEKAENQRGLSAGRSMLHFKTWIWLDDDKFYNEILPLIDNYTNYGIPALDKIAAHYGYTKN